MTIWIIVITCIWSVSVLIVFHYIDNLLYNVKALQKDLEYCTLLRQENAREFDDFVKYLGHVKEYRTSSFWYFRKRTKREK